VEARGEFIARQDADDISCPGRFAKQLQMLRSDPELSMVSSWGRGLGPEDEDLFSITRPVEKEEATRALLEGRLGPVGHGSMIYRANRYHQVGGYRVIFNYAEDWDLWLRLAEVGSLAYVPEFLYAFRVEEHSISAHRRDQQIRLKECAIRCHQARVKNLSEEPELHEASRLTALPLPSGRALRVGNSYFIGKCLLDRRDARAMGYLKRSVKQWPWQIRGWAALVAARFLCEPNGVTRMVEPKPPVA
jgi:hypothetical protein